MTVVLSARSSWGCLGPDYCWSHEYKPRLAKGRSASVGWGWKTPSIPDAYDFDVVCRASSHGRTAMATMNIPVI